MTMTPADPEAAQWKRIDENAQKIDGCNREIGEVKQHLQGVEKDQSNILDGVARVENKVDQALQAQERRSGAETLGRWVIGTVASLSAAIAAVWIWIHGGG